jgi:hypothetical protein
MAAVVGWALYLRLRIVVDPGLSEIREIGLPFVGFVQAFNSWIHSPIDLIVGLALFLVLGLFLRRAILQDHLVGWAFLGLVPVALVLTEQVWHSYYDIARAVAPLLTAFVLLVVVGNNDQSRRGLSAESSQPTSRRDATP